MKKAAKRRDRSGELHLRPPRDMLDQIKKAADDNRRTLNAQVLLYIERGMEAEKVGA